MTRLALARGMICLTTIAVLAGSVFGTVALQTAESVEPTTPATELTAGHGDWCWNYTDLSAPMVSSSYGSDWWYCCHSDGTVEINGSSCYWCNDSWEGVSCPQHPLPGGPIWGPPPGDPTPPPD